MCLQSGLSGPKDEYCRSVPPARDTFWAAGGLDMLHDRQFANRRSTMRTQRKRHLVRMSVTVSLLAVTLALGACGDDEDDAVPTTTPAATTQASPDIGDITDDYFGGPSYVGRTVTVQGNVTRVVGPSSFVLDGKGYGDDTLLVISAPSMDVEIGEQVDVTGVVRQFDYEIYRDGYGLADPGLYGDFDQEEVLVAGGAAGSGNPSAPGQSPSAAG
jgi:hypothetical protein